MIMNEIIIPGLQKRMQISTIFCIGRNYIEHAHELNNPVPKSPVIFIKPISSIIYSGYTVKLPPQSRDVHFETEVLVAIGKQGKNISEESAMDYIEGYGIGIDVTARDLQSEAKAKSLPWSVAKGFDTFAPISNFIPAEIVNNPRELTFTLEINGELRQKGNTSDMIFPINVLISKLSEFFTLNPGDLIFTGTPSGVGALNSGDELKAVLGDNLTTLEVNVQ
jgi:2-keto-4-pentenoate hydratase/2-oxohepta-3-ene-1,7-dioic acid hydratase in catechol pathway